ncbi:MAG: FHA domain-containing protein [Deltaproteobacteria bacterium]|nr:FHA domain-containing protein [Deltaproteobacteria bacterium]
MTEKSITNKEYNLAGGHVRFRFVEGEKNGEEVLVTRDTFFIGRNLNNNLVLDDRSVSRKHAVLNFVYGEYSLSDLNSFKGVEVNGKEVKEAVLHSGDRVRIGATVLEFLEADSASPPAKRRKKWIWPVIFIAIAAVAAVAVFFAIQSFNKGKISKELMREIVYQYSLGIKAYNVNKDIESAKKYWQEVVSMDPAGITIHGRNARILLSNLPGNLNNEPNR